MSDTQTFDPALLRFIPNPTIAGDEGAFITVTLALSKVLSSYRRSLFAHEWLDANGNPKPLEALNPAQRTQRRTVENAARMGHPLPQPVLGIGMLDCIEIGAGRDVLLTLAAAGVTAIPVHVPHMMVADFQKFVAPAAPAKKSAERGNVMVYILLAIVLIAALSMAVSNSSRFGSTGMLSEGQEKAAVNEILTYANAVKSTVSKLTLRGCADDEISFASSKWAVPFEYSNPSAPADNTCDVFHESGGALEFKTPPQEISPWTEYLYSGVFQIGAIGLDTAADPAEAKELLLILRVTGPACLLLNDQLGVINTGGIPPQYQIGAFIQDNSEKFGALNRYIDCCSIGRVGGGMSPNGDELYTKLAGCYQSQDNGGYYFINTLIAR